MNLEHVSNLMMLLTYYEQVSFEIIQLALRRSIHTKYNVMALISYVQHKKLKTIVNVYVFPFRMF